MVVCHQLFACVRLIFWGPGQVVNFVARPDELLGRAMTIQAPPHVKGLSLPDQRHLVHPAVTARTADSFGDVDAVIEINIIRQIVNAVPLQRPAGCETFPDRLEHGRVRPNLGVARHAGVGARQTGKRRLLHCGMAVTAVDPIVADMMFVAERYRLIESHPYVGRIR